MPIQTINPYNNQLLKRYDELTEEQLNSKLETAHNAYLNWRRSEISQRRDLLLNVAGLFRQRKHELARLITIEMGKLIGQSESEVEMVASVYEYYAHNAAKFLEDRPLETTDGKAFVRLSPIGIVLGVEPWNYPFNQVARLAAPNIMAGNVVAIKHASNVPQCAEMIEKIFIEAGAPVGIYTNLFLSGKRVSKLGEDSRIAGMSLTGSEAAGSSLGESAGRNLKKSVLELGGSDAFIVLDDADVDLAVEKAYLGRFANMGQACTSAKRFIVMEAVADEFIGKLQKRIAGLKVGDPLDPDTEIGPLSTQDAVDKLDAQVTATIKAGATVLAGGNRMDREGAFYEFTILGDITPEMVAYKEELFGPVASFYRVQTQQQAIDLANDTTFGLGGVVFSRDADRAINVASQMETGMVFINENLASRPDLPFGGVKRSGYGRELSPLGIEEFVNKKLIRIANS